MNPKYQIFISSTYKDLVAERDQIIKAVLEMGHIPVGMEMFSAADEEQWEIIARAIDQSDYYVVLTAYRYGSMVGNISYTEKEYNYAVEQGVPVLGFVIEESTPWPTDRMDSDTKKKKALDRFKEKIKKKPVAFWESAADLYGKCPIALMKQMTRTPRPGWVRSTDVAGPDVANEFARLTKENAELREKLGQDDGYFGLSFDEMNAAISRGGLKLLHRVYRSGGGLSPLHKERVFVSELAGLGLLTENDKSYIKLSDVGRRFMLKTLFR